MITKLTADNNSRYQARFQLMNRAFEKKGKSLRIKSLEEYFSNIKTIYDFAIQYPEYTSRCLAMPVDEPVFEIDANARTITVPQEFKKNGISVLGDHYAETVYFKIDKYFDYQNFYGLLQGDSKGHVVINWSFTPLGSKVATEVKSVEAFGPDEDLEPGYLIFGWIIDRDMTINAGTLTFSVQFYHTTNDEIDYSFNTLPATVAVGYTLKMKSPTEVTNNATSLGLRLQNSAYRVDALGWPGNPSWILDLPDKINLNFVGADQQPIQLKAEAGLDKGLSINYRWFQTLHGSENAEEITGSDVYELTQDTSKQTEEKGTLYYKEVDGGYQLLLGNELDDAFAKLGTAEEIGIYERYTSIPVERAGRYSAQAQAIIDVSQVQIDSLDPADLAQLEALTNSIDSTVCNVPAASEPNVNLVVTSALDPTSFTLLEPDKEPQYIYIDSNTAPTITASIEREGQDIGALAAVMLNSEGKIVNTDIVFSDLTEEDITSGNYQFDIHNEDIPISNELTAQGQYKVGIINRLNGTYAKGESENIVTSFVAPKITDINVSAASGVEGASPVVLLDSGVRPNGNVVNVIMDDYPQFIFTDNTDYNNYRREGDNNPIEIQYELLEVLVDRSNPQQPTVQLDPNGAPVIKAESDTGIQELSAAGFKPTDAGDYLIRVTTIYHGTKNIGYTDIFSVTSRA